MWRPIGKLLRWMLALLIIVGLGYCALLWQNNRPANPVSKTTIDASYEKGVGWLLANRELVLRDSNPILWWMVGESARLSGDARLKNLYDEFSSNYQAQFPQSVWMVFFTPDRFRNANIPPDIYRSYVEYQQYFLYTITCSQAMAQDPLIVAQDDPGFCWHGTRVIRPACVTHQLMGYRFAQRNDCPFSNLNQNVGVLQNTLVKQLNFDPRVVDVYIQRVLMLVESGAGDRVKARWMQRVFEAQLADGSWSDMQPLLSVGGGRSLGFGSAGFVVGEPQGNFHATAQGIWLAALLRSR